MHTRRFVTALVAVGSEQALAPALAPLRPSQKGLASKSAYGRQLPPPSVLSHPLRTCRLCCIVYRVYVGQSESYFFFFFNVLVAELSIVK